MRWPNSNSRPRSMTSRPFAGPPRHTCGITMVRTLAGTLRADAADYPGHRRDAAPAITGGVAAGARKRLSSRARPEPVHDSCVAPTWTDAPGVLDSRRARLSPGCPLGLGRDGVPRLSRAGGPGVSPSSGLDAAPCTGPGRRPLSRGASGPRRRRPPGMGEQVVELPGALRDRSRNEPSVGCDRKRASPTIDRSTPVRAASAAARPGIGSGTPSAAHAACCKRHGGRVSASGRLTRAW